jgi:hypothetical protein
MGDSSLSPQKSLASGFESDANAWTVDLFHAGRDLTHLAGQNVSSSLNIASPGAQGSPGQTNTMRAHRILVQYST